MGKLTRKQKSKRAAVAAACRKARKEKENKINCNAQNDDNIEDSVGSPMSDESSNSLPSLAPPSPVNLLDYDINKYSITNLQKLQWEDNEFLYPINDIASKNDNQNKEKTDDDLGAPIFVRGKQIMTVNTFVREIDDLRAASTKQSKKGYGNMSPIVLVQNDTPHQISMKKRELKKQSEAKQSEADFQRNKIISSDADFQRNRVIFSDEDEEEAEAAVDDPSGLVSPERCSSPSSPLDLAERPRPASSLSSAASYEDYVSDSDSLPDLSENLDPSYEDARMNVRKEKSPKKSPLKEKKKKKKKFIIKGSSKLMKSAKMNCLKKQQMFIRSDKDKRLAKGGREGDKSNISTPEPQMKPQTTVQPYKTTGFAQLKPHAKSPKDVERGLQRDVERGLQRTVEHTTKPKEPKDLANMPPDEVRKLLRCRLDSPPSKKKGIEISQGSSNSKSPTRADNTIPDCQETSHPDNSNHSYDSEETVTYDEDVQRRNAEVISDIGAIKPESIKKRKSVDNMEPNKRLKETSMKSPPGPELLTVTSPVHFASEMDGKVPFMIQHIEGGVHDAFGTPEKETEVSAPPTTPSVLPITSSPPPAISSAPRTPSSCIPIKKLTKQFGLKIVKKNECEKKLRDEREAYERRIAPILEDKQKLEKDIEALLVQIQQFEEDSTAPPSHEGSALHTSEGIACGTSKQGPNKAINIIPDANMSNFGVVGSSSYSGNTSATQATSDSAASQELTINMKKRGRPRKTSNAASPKSKKRSPSPEIVLLESSSSSSSSKNATGTPSSQRHPNVYRGPDGLAFHDPTKVGVASQHVANQNHPPSYAEAVSSSRLSQQAQSQSQIHSHLQSITQTQQLTQAATRPIAPSGQSPSLQHLASLRPHSYQISSQPQSQTHMQFLPTKNMQQLQSQQQIIQHYPHQFQPHQLSDPQSKGRPTQAMGPSSLPPDQQVVILQQGQQQHQILSIAMPNKPQQSQQPQGLYILPVSQGVSTTNTLIGIPTPMVSSVTTSAPQPDLQIAIGGSSSSSSTIAVSTASGANVQQSAIGGKRNPLLNELLDQGKQRPGPLSSKMSHKLAAKATVPNPQANPLTGLTTQLPGAAAAATAAAAAAAAAAQESSIAQGLGSAVSRQVQPPQGSRPPPKSHLLVKTLPPITSGVAAQARTLPSIVTPTVSSNTVTGSKTAAPLDQSTEHHVEPNFQDMSVANEDEPTSSPEAEQSCFLCGSPGEFVCCNMIVYCSEDCKGKDWSRHETECTRSNS